MVVYAGGSALLALVVKPIFDDVLRVAPSTLGRRGQPHRRRVLLPRASALRVRLPDGRRRPARRARSAQSAVPPHPRPVGGVLLAPDVGSTRFAHHERRQPGPDGVSETLGRSDPRIAGRGRLRRARCSISTAASRSSCLTAAPLIVYPLVRLGQRVRQDDAPRPGAARARHAHRDRGVRRPSHREGVRRRRAGGAAVRRRDRVRCIART